MKKSKYKTKVKFLTHFYSDVVVKYRKFNDSVSAYENLSNKYTVTYVPTKHNSDEAYNLHYMRTETNDHDARDATITLNMFKIKQDPILKDEGQSCNAMVSSDHNNDHFFQMVTHQADEVENLYAPFYPPRSADSISNQQNEQFERFMPLRKSLEPISSEFLICHTNANTHEEEPHRHPFQEAQAIDSTSVFAGEGNFDYGHQSTHVFSQTQFFP